MRSFVPLRYSFFLSQGGRLCMRKKRVDTPRSLLFKKVMMYTVHRENSRTFRNASLEHYLCFELNSTKTW